MSLVKVVESVLEGEASQLTQMAHISALIFHEMKKVNWAGFYLYDGNELVVGPYQGKLACSRIPLGKGVCGTAAAQNKTICVEDVENFPGHIACDSASKSEVVVPIFFGDQLFGVLDIDSPELSRFTNSEVRVFEEIVDYFKRINS